MASKAAAGLMLLAAGLVLAQRRRPAASVSQAPAVAPALPAGLFEWDGYWWARQPAEQPAPVPVSYSAGAWADPWSWGGSGGYQVMSDPVTGWTPPAAAWPYLADVYAAEDAYGMPRNLLARLLYQESRYREDIITGQVVSSAGAVGIAQIVPKWHPGVDPLDPRASIFYAADYLRAQFNRFGSWTLALAAYNWGPGNLSSKGLAAAPRETVAYYTQILGDVPVGEGVAYA